MVDHAPDSFYELFDPIGDSVIVVGDFEFCPLEHKSDEDPVEYMRSLKHGCVKSAENMKALHLKRGGRAELCKTFDCNHYGIRQ